MASNFRKIKNDLVTHFSEKASADAGWINGGFYLLSPSVCELIKGDDTLWEHEPIETLVAQGELVAFRHESFWHPMDTLRERTYLQEEWQRGSAHWKIW